MLNQGYNLAAKRHLHFVWRRVVEVEMEENEENELEVSEKLVDFSEKSVNS